MTCVLFPRYYIAITNKIYLKFTFGHTFTSKAPLKLFVTVRPIFYYSLNPLNCDSEPFQSIPIYYIRCLYKKGIVRRMFKTLTPKHLLFYKILNAFFISYSQIDNKFLNDYIMFLFCMAYIHMFLKLICIHLN